VARDFDAAGVLDGLEGPGLDVPFALGHAADVVVDEEALGFDAQDQAVGDGALARDELRPRFAREVVAELVDGADLDLGRVVGGVGPAVGGGWGRARGAVRGGVAAFAAAGDAAAGGVVREGFGGGGGAAGGVVGPVGVLVFGADVGAGGGLLVGGGLEWT
jgi:hypothetical protein